MPYCYCDQRPKFCEMKDLVTLKCGDLSSGPESKSYEIKSSANDQLIDNTTLLLHKIKNNESQGTL